jgi:hypothetical protein
MRGDGNPGGAGSLCAARVRRNGPRNAKCEEAALGRRGEAQEETKTEGDGDGDGDEDEPTGSGREM